MERIIGVETEYAINAIGADLQPMSREVLAHSLLNAAHTRLRGLPDDASSGLFLSNGARFYVDAGSHPEITTPECDNPWDVVRYVRAGEAILRDLADGIEGLVGTEVDIYRCQVDYAGGSGATWGRHESYLLRGSHAHVAAALIPHLASRIVFCGAGGFNNLSPSSDFVLSPRAPHLRHETSGDSTSDRGIFHTKDEPLADGAYHRLHLICGESLCSDLATWLKVGTTALVVALIEADACDASAMSLRDALAAMRRFAVDTTMRAQTITAGGRMVRAIDIQRHYLELAERNLTRSFMPQWAAEVCAQWRAILDALERGPDAVATRLDWAMKLSLFRRHCDNRGIPWKAWQHWGHVAEQLIVAQRRAGDHGALIADLATSTHPVLRDVAERLKPYMREHQLEWRDFSRYLRLRHELFEIDVKFCQLGPFSIFAHLANAGALDHHVDGVDRIVEAMSEPTRQPRAQRRGELIRELAKHEPRAHTADWQMIRDVANDRIIDLTDPFGRGGDWVSLSQPDMAGRFPEIALRRLRGMRRRAAGG